MSITVTVNLSDALSGFAGTGVLKQANVFAYAVYFQNGTANWTTLADGSGSTPASSTAITITTPYDSGKIYFIIQSGAGNDLMSLITKEADISWTNAQDWDFRYDSVELTVNGNANDVANLTDVNGFGLPMSISNGLSTNGSRGYAQSGTAMFSDIAAASTNPGQQTAAANQYSDAPLAPGQRMMYSPTEALDQNNTAFAASDWTNYVTSLQAAAGNVRLSGWFNGAPDANNVWHNAGYYAYQLSYENGYFWLNPQANSQIKGYIRISPDQLANSIYATLGTASIFVNKTDATPYTTMNVGANNQWGEIFTNLLTGFTAGYYGETGQSPNSLVTGGISLYNSANWDPTYAFGNNLQQPNPLSGATYDKYAQLFYNQSNSYGAGYSDNLTKALSVGPLMPLWNTSSGVNTPLTITLYADSDTPATAAFQGSLLGDMGFLAPQIYNYINTGGTFANLTDIGGDAYFAGGNNFTFNLAGSNVYLDTSSKLTFGIWNGSGFTTLDLPTTPTSFWNTYTLNYTAGTGFSFSTAANAASPGSIGITNLPVAVTDGNVGWYQLTVASSQPGGWSKTFNLYATTSDPSSQVYTFVNPQATPGAAAGDGLVVAQGTAGATPPSAVNSITWAFLTASGYGLDSSLIARNATAESILNPGNATYTSPFAPVIGSMKSGAFTNYMVTPGAYTVGPTPNAYAVNGAGVNPTSVIPQTTQVFPDGAQFTNNLVTYTLADTVAKAKIAFGWWAADPTWVATNANQNRVVLNHDTTSDIAWDGTSTSISRWNPLNQSQGYVQGQYTNKVGALNIAMVQFISSDASGTYTKHAPITVAADLDGVWTTKNTLFVNGTYKAVLMEYAPDDKQFATPLNKASDGIVFAVDGSGGGGSISGSGGGISYNGGGDGTWVRLDSTTSTLTNGTLFVYFTDSSGNLLDRNDSVTATLQDAIRAEIGLVKTDGGSLMFNGIQSVYLPTGMVMKFAIEVGNGVIKALPDIQVNGTGTLSVSVSDSSGVLNLSAVMDRSPGPNAGLALTQHEFDRAWVWLTQGERVQVDVAGSAYNNNTLHFVRIDTDASDPSSSAGWTVGGVAWGNTDAFRAAVQANWEAGYSAAGGRGNFQDTKTFTAGKAGYYAPVLTTEGGDTFVIGATANVDSREHIRTYGQSTFGFEDVKGGDWDYNDLVMKLTTT